MQHNAFTAYCWLQTNNRSYTRKVGQNQATQTKIKHQSEYTAADTEMSTLPYALQYTNNSNNNTYIHTYRKIYRAL